MCAILSPEILQAEAVKGLIVHFFIFLISTEVVYISADKFVSVFDVSNPGWSSSPEQPVA